MHKFDYDELFIPSLNGRTCKGLWQGSGDYGPRILGRRVPQKNYRPFSLLANQRENVTKIPKNIKASSWKKPKLATFYVMFLVKQLSWKGTPSRNPKCLMIWMDFGFWEKFVFWGSNLLILWDAEWYFGNSRPNLPKREKKRRRETVTEGKREGEREREDEKMWRTEKEREDVCRCEDVKMWRRELNFPQPSCKKTWNPGSPYGALVYFNQFQEFHFGNSIPTGLDILGSKSGNGNRFKYIDALP